MSPVSIGTDFFYISSTASSLKIYNSDYSLRKVVNYIIPNDYRLEFSNSNFGISNHIFNTDNKLELIIHLFNKVTKDFKMQVINEDGALIYDFSSSDTNFKHNFHEIYNNKSTNVNKIIINYSSLDYTSYIQKIYALPSTTLSLSENPKVGEISKVLFPIPTKSLLTFRNPENGSKSVEVFDNTGKLVFTEEYSASDNDITINVERLIKGTYILKSGNYSTKFIKE